MNMTRKIQLSILAIAAGPMFAGAAAADTLSCSASGNSMVCTVQVTESRPQINSLQVTSTATIPLRVTEGVESGRCGAATMARVPMDHTLSPGTAYTVALNLSRSGSGGLLQVAGPQCATVTFFCATAVRDQAIPCNGLLNVIGNAM